MTRLEALKLADDQLVSRIASGDEELWARVGFDKRRMVSLALHERHVIADQILLTANWESGNA